MKKYQDKEDQVITKELVSISCDLCSAVTTKESFFTQPYIIEFEHEFGYGSEHDQGTLKFDLCEGCLLGLLEKNNINYNIKEKYE